VSSEMNLIDVMHALMEEREKETERKKMVV
jgi:hypothetical protein